MCKSLYSPRYYSKFSCIADKCPQSCCRSGWEIPIDDDTYDFYISCGVDDLEENTVQGSDGGRIFRLRPDGACAYLEPNGLCRLYIKTGGRLGEICDKYPRFFEEYDGFTEAGISISCPEARRLILCAGRGDYQIEGETPDEELLAFLHRARQKAFDTIFTSDTADMAANRLINFGYLLQDAIDYDEIYDDLPELSETEQDDSIDLEISQYASLILENTEILYPQWRELLQKCAAGSKPTDRPADSTLKAYLAYLIYRFFLKSIANENTVATCVFIVMSLRLITSLDCDFEEASALFSKEIEHDADNYARIIDELDRLYPGD